jgi:hypothetical protein
MSGYVGQQTHNALSGYVGQQTHNAMSAPKVLGEWQNPAVEAALNSRARRDSALSRGGIAMLLLAMAGSLVIFKGDGWVHIRLRA